MPRLVTYKCPDCSGQFDFLHHPSDEPPPERCELCGSFMGDEPEKAPVLYLKIGTAKGKGPDKIYRQMEKGSEERVAAAVEMGGGDASDYSNLKITDLKDARHEGEIAAPSTTQAQKNLSYEVMGRKIGPEMQSPNAKAFAEQTTTGPNALATRGMITDLQNSGRARANEHRLTAAGNMGSYKGA